MKPDPFSSSSKWSSAMKCTIFTIIIIIVMAPIRVHAQKIDYTNDWKKAIGMGAVYERTVNIKATSACPECHTYHLSTYHGTEVVSINEAWSNNYSVMLTMGKVCSIENIRKQNKVLKYNVVTGCYHYSDLDGDGKFDVMINVDSNDPDEKVFILLDRTWVPVKDQIGGI